jgi:hypothetical protein
MQNNDELQQILKKLDRHFRQAKDVINGFSPKNTLETNSLNFLRSVFDAIKSGIKSLAEFYQQGNQPPEAPNHIEEMSAAGAGAAIGGIGSNKPGRKEYIKEKDQVDESMVKLRSAIREAIEDLYNKDKSLLTESNIRAIFENSEMNSTGMNKLNQVFNEIRSVIEERYMQLTTTAEQRHSFSVHLLNSISDELNRLDANLTVSSKESQFNNAVPQQANEAMEPAKKLPPKDDDDAFKQKFTISGLNETGRNEALEIYKNIFPKIEEAFNNLSDAEDRKIFKQYLIENLEALFETLEDQLKPSDENEFDDFSNDDEQDIQQPLPQGQQMPQQNQQPINKI